MAGRSSKARVGQRCLCLQQTICFEGWQLERLSHECPKRACLRIRSPQYSGRVSQTVGLEHGGDVVIELVGREIRIRTIDEVVAQAQAIARRLTEGKPDASVDAFLAERRREAARE